MSVADIFALVLIALSFVLAFFNTSGYLNIENPIWLSKVWTVINRPNVAISLFLIAMLVLFIFG